MRVSLRSVWLAISLLAAPTLGQGLVQGPGGSLYGVTPGISSWTAAQDYARSQGGHLVTIEGPVENMFLQTTFFGPSNPNEDFWIGYYCPTGDAANPNDYEWVSGSSASYSNWRPGQPDVGGEHRYVAINFIGGSSLFWDNYPDDGFRTIRGIYEIPAGGSVTPITACQPTPATLVGAGPVSVGGSLELDLDGGQISPAFTLLAISSAPAGGVCGIPTGFGEVLIGVIPPDPFYLQAGPVWTSGSPARLSEAIPNDPTLLGRSFFAQGAFFAPASTERFRLSNGVQATIGT